MRRFASYALPILVWCATLFYLSSLPSVPSPGFRFSDKLLHAGAYSVMGMVFARAALGYGAKVSAAIWLGAAFASLYGATDEVHQMFTPGRSPDVMDWVADTVGGAGGAALFVRFAPRIFR